MNIDVNGLIRNIRAVVGKANVALISKRTAKAAKAEFAETFARIEEEGKLRIALEQIPVIIGKAIIEGAETAEVGMLTLEDLGPDVRCHRYVLAEGWKPALHQIKTCSNAAEIINACERAGLRPHLENFSESSWRIVVTKFSA